MLNVSITSQNRYAAGEVYTVYIYMYIPIPPHERVYKIVKLDAICPSLPQYIFWYWYGLDEWILAFVVVQWLQHFMNRFVALPLLAVTEKLYCNSKFFVDSVGYSKQQQQTLVLLSCGKHVMFCICMDKNTKVLQSGIHDFFTKH